MEPKREIRRRILQERANIEEERWIRDTDRIASAVIRHPWFEVEKDLYIYADCQGEVGTGRIMEEAFQRGKNVWVPRVTGNTMHFYRIRGMEELRPGTYGILEPTGTEAADGEHGLMVMPGVAFDEERRRVGYGGGFYDRYLEYHRNLRRMAIAFEFQIVDRVPCEEHDVCPEVLITERRVIGPGQKDGSGAEDGNMQTGLPKDPVMMLSVVNTKLRDFYSSLDDLCEDMGVEREEIAAQLRAAGYEYDEERRQFI